MKPILLIAAALVASGCTSAMRKELVNPDALNFVWVVPPKPPNEHGLLLACELWQDDDERLSASMVLTNQGQAHVSVLSQASGWPGARVTDGLVILGRGLHREGVFLEGGKADPTAVSLVAPGESLRLYIGWEFVGEPLALELWGSTKALPHPLPPVACGTQYSVLPSAEPDYVDPYHWVASESVQLRIERRPQDARGGTE